MFPVWKAISTPEFYFISSVYLVQNVCKFRVYICPKFKSWESYDVREKILGFALERHAADGAIRIR